MKKMLLLLAFCMLGLVTTAFANPPPKKLEKLTVMLDWFINPDHAPLFVAQQQGYFRAQGLAVRFIAPSDPADPPKLVAAGKADIALDYQPHLLLAIAQGLPLAQVGTLIATPLNCLTVLADGPIRNLHDLKGKRIGYSSGEVDEVMLRTMLQKQGLNLHDVQLINVHYDLTQALLAKKVDAVSGMMRNFELIQLQLAGHPARAFYPEENGMPSYDELVYITRRDKRDDPRINRFLAAVEQGVQYLVNHPQTSWRTFASQHPELNNELNRRAWLATLPRFALRPAVQDRGRCLRLAAYLSRALQAKTLPAVCE